MDSTRAISSPRRSTPRRTTSPRVGALRDAVRRPSLAPLLTREKRFGQPKAPGLSPTSSVRLSGSPRGRGLSRCRLRRRAFTEGFRADPPHSPGPSPHRSPRRPRNLESSSSSRYFVQLLEVPGLTRRVVVDVRDLHEVTSTDALSRSKRHTIETPDLLRRISTSAERRRKYGGGRCRRRKVETST